MPIYGADDDEDLQEQQDNNPEIEWPEADEEAPDAEQLIDSLFSDEGEEVESGGPDEVPLVGSIPEPYYAQPVNRATMTCLRGPCQHYWQIVARYVAPGKELHAKAIRQCNCHGEETPLGGQNVYHCNRWWPQWAMFVPQSLRPALRPILQRSYQTILELLDYDFSWKTWSDDVFESDRKGMRERGGPGGVRIISLTDATKQAGE